MVSLYDRPGAESEAAGVAHRRQPTPIVILDRNLRTIAQSFQFDSSEIAGRIRGAVERHIAERTLDAHATFEMIDAETALRVIDLVADDGVCFAVTFERFEHKRDAIEDVATAHRLTSREREVFRMLLAGATDSEVSERLAIARTTASDHAKNILRKTGASKRAELFAEVIKYAGRPR
ncbi:MAG TPA: helix-turn-helix transcriptional regulator [Candidatus Acidoferrum sp.]|nr:helix-turn-helix transcriptional regulator [Candidatus Acidoferrum sp.]